jgi:hypothetical protein
MDTFMSQGCIRKVRQESLRAKYKAHGNGRSHT